MASSKLLPLRSGSSPVDQHPLMNPFPTARAANPLGGSIQDYLTHPGPDLADKAKAFCAWYDARVAQGGFPYGKQLLATPGAETSVQHADGQVTHGINFASQDYLGLATHPAIREAALDAMDRYGVHSGGSPTLAGGVSLCEPLCELIGEYLQMPYVVLSPTGWAAGYGLLRGLVRETDHVVIDQLAHNCLHEGAAASTRQVHVFRHLDVNHARLKLGAIRARDPRGGILLVTESLFSMDADSPDLAAFQRLCREFNAMLVVDVAHDFGCNGTDGTGELGRQGMLGKIDLVIGTFSKTFATNGGFVATHRREIREYLRHLSPSTTFSSAISPLQVAIAHAALQLVRSEEGAQRRRQLAGAVAVLREELSQRNIELMGRPAPMVPVLIGRDDVARTAVRLLADAGVVTNLIEYPAVSRATARFRLQVMSSHTPAMCRAAAAKVAQAITAARELCSPAARAIAV